MDKCPVCSNTVQVQWEHTFLNGRGWSGLYHCYRCGLIKASGSVSTGKRIVCSWLPNCTDHRSDHMVQLRDDLFECQSPGCGRAFEVRNGRIIPTGKMAMRVPAERVLRLVKPDRRVAVN